MVILGKNETGIDACVSPNTEHRKVEFENGLKVYNSSFKTKDEIILAS
jgi:hypothetical protein